ncbi:uncharacterized protein TNIN_479551 [Trichonephila inaurata madagascariensis]|uniref:Uncharacterized protein n=1 Tax=Trichonephila inaurata madagascariensis TaxID=2747483 RepID=A0A8X7CT38_9ARAC|nr:uncharacterized protein TNIN_479551 [Trichonephila inaurata madagascariensis]
MTQLLRVGLKNNKITNIPEKVFRGIYDHLLVLLLEGNPISCNCTFKWIVSGTEHNPDKYITGICDSPQEMKGRELIDLGLLCNCWAVDPRDTCPKAEELTPCFCQKHFETGRAIVRCESIASNDILLDVLNKTSDYEYESLFVDLSTLTYIPSTIFEIKKLTNVYIFASAMVSLFDKPPNATFLEVLYLNELKLTRTIQYDLFAGFPNLKELYIESSKTRNLDQTFRDNVAKTLTKLTLKNCSIEKFDDQIFASLDNLVEISLEDNKVKEPKRSMFSSPSKLEKINLK